MTDATPEEIAAIVRGLTASMPKALSALSADFWQTAAEAKSKTSSASLDILYIMNGRAPLCERRWTKWGSEQGQKRGEGYEYRLTPLGLAVRKALVDDGGKGAG
jgi:hypothetical protein